jgi:hypothetical protein
MVLYKKEFVTKTGDIKVYEYDQNSSKYSKKYYENKKAKQPKVPCNVCGRMVYGFYMNRHQVKTTCRANALNHIKTISKAQAPTTEKN